MVIRRAELPSLNMTITRRIVYDAGRDRFGGVRQGNLTRPARCRQIESSPTRQLSVAAPIYQDLQLRSYVVRPDREMFTFDFDLGNDTTEERTIPLEWTQVDQTFRDAGGVKWDVRGVGFYDSAGRMLHIFASRASDQT